MVRATPADWSFTADATQAMVQGNWSSVEDSTYQFEIQRNAGTNLEPDWVTVEITNTHETSFERDSTDGILFASTYRARVRAVANVISFSLAEASGFQDDPTWGTHPPSNAIDGVRSTRWSHDDNPSILTCTVAGGTNSISGVSIHHYNGNNGSKATFDIEISTDGFTWIPVYRGESTGTVDWDEEYRFPTIGASYVRYVGRGRDNSPWNSVVEIAPLGSDGLDYLPTPPTATATPGDTVIDLDGSASRPSPTVDSWEWLWGTTNPPLQTLVSGLADPEYTHTERTNGTTYYYQLVAYNEDGSTSSSIINAAPTGTTPPPDTEVTHGDQLTTANTGSDAKETLTLHSGSFSTSYNGQIIENLFIDHQGGWSTNNALQIRHSNVKVRNVYVRMKKVSGGAGASNGRYYPSVIRVESGLTGVTFDHVTSDGDRALYGTGRADANQGNNGFKLYSPVTLTRCYVTSCRQAVQIWGGAFPSHFYENYIRESWRGSSGVSTTGLSFRCHTGSSNSLVKYIVRNRFACHHMNASWTLSAESGPAQNFEIHDNYIEGTISPQDGNYPQIGAKFGWQPVNSGTHRYNNRDLKITGNKSVGSYQFGSYMYLDQSQPGVVWSNNTHNGSTVTNTYKNG